MKKPINEVYVPLDKATFLVRNGLGKDQSRLTYYTQALQDPQRMVVQIAFRGYVGELLENLNKWIFTDSVAYSRLVSYLVSQNRPSRFPNIRPRAFEALIHKSLKARLPVETLAEVYNRGYQDVNKPQHLTKEQHAFNHVNSFIAGGKARIDEQDVVDKRKEATTSLVKTYKDDTPGQRKKTFQTIKKTIGRKNEKL